MKKVGRYKGEHQIKSVKNYILLRIWRKWQMSGIKIKKKINSTVRRVSNDGCKKSIKSCEITKREHEIKNVSAWQAFIRGVTVKYFCPIKEKN